MRTISKSDSPAPLKCAYDAGWSWDEFHHNDREGYREVVSQALADQHNECAYTGLWLGSGTTQRVHLDHFLKKSLYPGERFRYANLFAAAKDLEYGSDAKDRQISGPLDNSNRQYRDFWSPLEANLEDKFWYSTDGDILPHPGLSEEDKEKATRTIEMYNLRHNDLKNRRAQILRYMEGFTGCEDDDIREYMKVLGFSFVIEFVLRHPA